MPDTLTKTGFDYTMVEPRKRAVVRSAAAEIHRRLKRSAEDVIAIGKSLLASKDALEHGQFGTWLEAEFEWDQKTAERYMGSAIAFGKIDNLSNLNITPSALYVLAAPSTPPEVRESILAAAESGETVTHAMVKEAVAAARVPAAPEDQDLWDIVSHLRASVEKLVEKSPSNYREPLGRHLIALGEELIGGDDGKL